MEIEIKMPQLGQTSDEVRLVKWLVGVGEEVKRGQPLCEVETDKVTMEMESYEQGKVIKLLAAEDSTVKTGEVIVILEDFKDKLKEEKVSGSVADIKTDTKTEETKDEKILKELGENKLIQMLTTMIEIRQFEERIKLLFLQGKMPGTIHQYIGMEACAVGACAALNDNDVIASTHRPNGHAIAKGLPMTELMAELYGKTTGCCKGKGGAMHLGDINRGMLTSIAIVGGNIPIVAGMALAFKMRKENRVAISFFGDGASNEGTFHEALNIASIYNLPAVFVCENNTYGASTSVKKVMKVKNVADRACAYAMRSDIADGMNVLDVYYKTKASIDFARSGKGPTLLELKTFRLCGHSRRDPNNYMTDEEKKYWKARDPINLFQDLLIKEKILENKDIEKIRDQVERKIDESLEFAENSPDPKPEDTYEDLYVTMEVPR